MNDLIFPPCWKLTASENRILSALAKRAFVSAEAMYEALYGDKRNPPLPRTMNVWMTRLRKKVRPRGFTIAVMDKRGWYMEKADRVRLAEAAAEWQRD